MDNYKPHFPLRRVHPKRKMILARELLRQLGVDARNWTPRQVLSAVVAHGYIWNGQRREWIEVLP
jgi:hypothetical protein